LDKNAPLNKIFRDFLKKFCHNTSMTRKQRWIWEAYFVIILPYSVQQFYFLFSKDSPHYLYYLILRSFDPIFMAKYIAYIVDVALDLIHCLPLFLYIHRIRFLNPALWKIMFILRCIFEIIGHSYEMNTFAAFYHTKPKFLLAALAVMIMPHIPSYVACYWYAFRTGNLK